MLKLGDRDYIFGMRNFGKNDKDFHVRETEKLCIRNEE